MRCCCGGNPSKPQLCLPHGEQQWIHCAAGGGGLGATIHGPGEDAWVSPHGHSLAVLQAAHPVLSEGGTGLPSACCGKCHRWVTLGSCGVVTGGQLIHFSQHGLWFLVRGLYLSQGRLGGGCNSLKKT